MARRVKSTRRRPSFPRVGFCFFCREGTSPDWKNPESLTRFISERGKIMATERTGLCHKHQKKLANAIKRARFLGLLPFIVRVK